MTAKSNRVHAKRAANDKDVILENGKVFIPLPFHQRALNWHHHWLIHPGSFRMHKTINLTATWPNLKSEVENWCKTCKRCQLSKKKTVRYSELPAKVAEAIPWHDAQIDCIGPCTVHQLANGKVVKFKMWALTIIDAVTYWFEICPIPADDMFSEKISTLFYDA